MTIGQFGLQYPGSAGSHEHANARGAVFISDGFDRFAESFLLQTQLGQAIVAAIVCGQIGAYAIAIQLFDLGNVGFQIDILERAGNQSLTPRAQGIHGCRRTQAQAVRECVVTDD